MEENIIPKILVRDLYGEQIEALQVNEFIIIELSDRIRVLNFIAARYEKTRLFRSSKEGSICKLFRVK